MRVIYLPEIMFNYTTTQKLCIHSTVICIYRIFQLGVDGDTTVYNKEGMDPANTYVAFSRHKNRCQIFKMMKS